MGRITLNEFQGSPFEVSVTDLIALQKLVVHRRHRVPKQHAGAALSQSKVRGRGMDFVETRNYYPGDDIRLMDWRVTARTNKPHVKVFQVERERPVMIFYDLSPTQFFGTKGCLKSVLSAKLAALLAWTARAHGDRVGGYISSLARQSLWLPHAHNSTLINFLKAVSDGTQHYNDRKWNDWHQKSYAAIFLKGLKECIKVLKPGTLLLIVSDWQYEPTLIEPYLMELRLHHDMILYHTLDKIEMSIPREGLYPISDGKKVMSMNMYIKQQQEQYQVFCQERTRQWYMLAKKIHVPYLTFDIETDLSLLVQQSLLRSLRG